MTDKIPFDLDAALAALEQDERAVWPKVSEKLQMRVLGDAAEVAVARARTTAPVSRAPVRSGGFHWFGLSDVWSGAAIAAVTLCLFVGFGVGYEAGPELMAQAGLGDTAIAFAEDDGGGFSPFEDVL
ncbi:MAG TPA: hypothetical protein VMY41_06435 [Thermohalobaculum sp.]|nr:hypothetical protein [Thermohalobaculum sp.]